MGTMQKNTLLQIAGAAGLLLLAACATETKTAGGGDKKACPIRSSITGWQEVDATHFVVDAPKSYLVTVNKPCDLRFSETIAIDAVGPDFCLNVQDRLHTKDDSCFITEIESVANLKAAKLLVAERKAAAKASAQ
jgi:hypothetical protein